MSQYPFLFGLSVAICWSFLVCISRIYMGMHSVLVSKTLISDFIHLRIYVQFVCTYFYIVNSENVFLPVFKGSIVINHS